MSSYPVLNQTSGTMMPPCSVTYVIPTSTSTSQPRSTLHWPDGFHPPNPSSPSSSFSKRRRRRSKSYVAPDPFVMPPRVESVYINADLTPTEAKLAFEERVRRRARGNKSQSHPPRPGASAMDSVEVMDAGTNAPGGSSADVESHDWWFAGVSPVIQSVNIADTGSKNVSATTNSVNNTCSAQFNFANCMLINAQSIL